jgi:hypothetical protein
VLAGDVLKGAFSIYRQEVRPFAARHIELVDKFADQAVIARKRPTPDRDPLPFTQPCGVPRSA